MSTTIEQMLEKYRTAEGTYEKGYFEAMCEYAQQEAIEFAEQG